MPGTNGSQNKESWDEQGRCFGEMLGVTLVSARRWQVQGRAEPCMGCANSTGRAQAMIPGGKKDALGETRVPLEPVPAPLQRHAERSGYSLSRQGSQTVWLTPQGCTTPSPRLQALQHSPLVVYILVKQFSLEPQVGPCQSKQSQEVTPVMGPSLQGQAEKEPSSRLWGDIPSEGQRELTLNKEMTSLCGTCSSLLSCRARGSSGKPMPL